MTNLVTNVGSTAEEHPEETAVWYDGTDISYRDLWGQTGAFASGLDDAGVDVGGRVGIYLPNLPQFVVGFHGTLRAGGVVVPMNPQYKSREIEHMLSDSGAEVVVTLPDLAEHVADVRDETDVHTVVTIGQAVEGTVSFEEFCGDPAFETVDRADDEVACQPYTSGTTGTPKGVLLTHDNLASNAEMSASLVPNGITTDDKQLGVLPLFHIYGMTVVMNGAMYNGATYYPLPTWEADEAMELVEDEQLTIFHGVPAMFNDIVNHPDAADFDLSSLRFVNSGGSACPIQVMDRFEELTGTVLYEGYGLTETSPITHANRDGARRKGSIGRPIPGVDSKVVDHDFEEVPRVPEGPIDEEEWNLDEIVGEIVVSGPNVMQGYHGRPEANEEAFTTDEDGKVWFHTEDLGYWDEDDFFYVIDREKHMIVSGGYNIYPREVEELLFEHEAVADAAIVGIPDDRRGEIPKAFIVLAAGYEAGEDVTEDDIQQYCLDNLAAYKHPREVEFVEELPRTTTGKVQKFELKGEDA